MDENNGHFDTMDERLHPGGLRQKSKVPRARFQQRSELLEHSSNEHRNGTLRITSHCSREQRRSTIASSVLHADSDTDDNKEWQKLLGERVCISGVKQGVLRYYGRTNFAQGFWCGVELDEPVGKNNGTVNGIVYFICEPNHGIFAPVSKVSKLNDLSGDVWREQPCSARHLDQQQSNQDSDYNVKSVQNNVPLERRFIKNSSSDPTFMRQNGSAGMPHSSRSFSYDKRIITEQRNRNFKDVNNFEIAEMEYKSARTRSSSPPNIPMSSPSSYLLRKYGYGAQNQLFNSNVASLRENNAFKDTFVCDNLVPDVPKKNNLKTGLKTSKFSSEEYEFLHRTTTHSETDSPMLSDTKKLNDQPYFDYKISEAILNSFQVRDCADPEDEMDNDDQISADFDESLGILTPSKMKDCTLCPDLPTSCSDIRGIDFPSSESFDDINDLPEDEQVHDVSVHFLPDSTATSRSLEIMKQNNKGSYHKLDSKAEEYKDDVMVSSTDKFLFSISQKDFPECSIDSRYLSKSNCVEESYKLSSSELDYSRKINNLSMPDAPMNNIETGEKFVPDAFNVTFNPLSKICYTDKISKTNIVSQAAVPSSDISFSQFSALSIEQNKSSAPLSCYNICDNKKIKMLSLQNFADECIGRKNVDTDSSRDSLLQADVEHSSVLKEKLTVSWEDCVLHNNEYPFTSIERPDSVYTVASSDTGFQEDGEMEAETGMATSMESTESNKRFSTISRDSCIVTEDVDAYKIAESNSTSGYSTGLSDSCCNDRAEDDLSGKPLTDEEIQDSVGHCDSEDAFSFQDTSSISRDGDVLNAGMSDTTGETTVIFQDSTSDALCETMVEDATLTEIHDLLLSPEENQSIAHEDKENMAASEQPKPQSPESLSNKASDRSPSSTSSKPTPNSTPEKKLNVNNRPKVDSRRQPRIQNNINRTKTSRIGDEDSDKKKQLVKSPKKNVMSKIKAMIEATSCKTNNKINKNEEPVQKKVVSTPKRSRWEAVTSKIAASLAEEKTKPKTKREIKSRVDTNLALARQQASVCKSPKLDSRAEGSMSPISISSRRPLSEKNSAPNSVKDGRNNTSKDSKNSAKSPRPGRISSRSASPIAASESSTSLSLNSHSKIAQWKGSSSTVASSAAPTTSMAKRQTVAPPTAKPPLQTTRAAASRITAKKPATVTAPKTNIYLTVPTNTRIRPLSPSASSTRAERTIKQPRKTKEQAGPRGGPNTTRPVRPPMWLSKAELTQEIQRLSSLCEIRTKELNRLKMETKHVSMGFDAFSALFKYMVEDLGALSVPNLTAELDNTLKKLELTKQDLAYYEREVEEIKAHHSQELNDLSNKLFEVYQTEVAELNAKHQEEIDQLNDDHQKQIENLSLNFNTSSEEIKAQHENLLSKLEQELLTQREEMRSFQEREIKDLEDKHTQGTKVLQEHIEQLQKKCAELKQHSMSMEDAMRKDTDSKLQWVTSRKVDLEKEVESLKTVLEMKNKELHTLRIQNLEMEKQLEELPFAREKIKMLQARAEDLEALMNEKTKLERKLCSENQEIRDTYEKESKVNRRLSMENEELQWRLRQAEQSLLAGSFPEADETREEADGITSPSSESPGPQILSKSVFFTFVDKDESSGFSPRTPYKRITPGFSSNYKTSPGKASKSYSAPSPRKAKSHSEPPLPPSFSSTPRKMSKQASPKSNKKRQKPGSESSQHPEENEIVLMVTESSMTSSVSSENSIPEQKETLLEEHKEHIMASLEVIREQRNAQDSNELQMSQSMVEKQVSRPSNFETDMSRSAEFADPKSYYYMTFAGLKEPGMGDGDTDSSKVSSCNSSKEITPVTMHSISESSLNYSREKNIEQNAVKINISTTEVSTSVTVAGNTENKPTQIKSAHSDENFQKAEANACDIADHWRTI